MTPKEISRRAGRIFCNSLPSHWVIRNQEDQEDYGIDYEIELTTRGDKANGFIFKVQQKGVTDLSNDISDTEVSFAGLKVSRVNYYLHQLQIPVVLAVVDIATKTTYWLVLTGNPDVHESYERAIAKGHQSLTVKIPRSNRLPGTENALLRAVRASLVSILLREVTRVSSTDLLERAVEVANFDEVSRSMRGHSDLFRLAEIDRLIARGDVAVAESRCESILNSPSETYEMRFSGGMNLVRVQAARVSADRTLRLTEGLAPTRLFVASRLVEIARGSKAPKRLRLLARYQLRCARLAMLIERDVGLSLSLRVQQSTGDDFTRFVTESGRAENAARIAREYNRAQLNLLRLLQRGHYRLFAHAYVEIIYDVARFLVRLRVDGLNDVADGIVEWLDRVGDLVFAILKSGHAWTQLSMWATSQLWLAREHDRDDVERRFARARQCAQDIPDETIRDVLLEEIDLYRGQIDSADEELSIEDQVRMHRQMAAALGVDLEDSNDQIAQVVNIGLRDINPERVLKNCRHLFVSLGSAGIPAQMVGLPTAGSKWVHCTKFSHSIMGLSLDGVYDTFYESHCRECDSCEPHEDDWAWTQAWQMEQNAKHGAIAERANSAFDPQRHDNP